MGEFVEESGQIFQILPANYQQFAVQLVQTARLGTLTRHLQSDAALSYIAEIVGPIMQFVLQVVWAGQWHNWPELARIGIVLCANNTSFSFAITRWHDISLCLMDPSPDGHKPTETKRDAVLCVVQTSLETMIRTYCFDAFDYWYTEVRRIGKLLLARIDVSATWCSSSSSSSDTLIRIKRGHRRYLMKSVTRPIVYVALKFLEPCFFFSF